MLSVVEGFASYATETAEKWTVTSTLDIWDKSPCHGDPLFQ